MVRSVVRVVVLLAALFVVLGPPAESAAEGIDCDMIYADCPWDCPDEPWWSNDEIFITISLCCYDHGSCDLYIFDESCCS